MSLLNDMLRKEIKNTISSAIKNMNVDYETIINLKSFTALQKIKTVIEDDSLSDFECVERIVRIFESIGSDGGSRHDF
jgi:hypothetical protein